MLTNQYSVRPEGTFRENQPAGAAAATAAHVGRQHTQISGEQRGGRQRNKLVQQAVGRAARKSKHGSSWAGLNNNLPWPPGFKFMFIADFCCPSQVRQAAF